jgi:phage recombination protein Bet
LSAQPQQLITAAEVAAQKSEQRKLIPRFAERYGIDADKLLSTLSNTAFKVKDGVSNEQMMALLIVAEAHKLNPFTREIFAFPSQNGIVPVVSVDGWAKLINEHPQFDGMDFEQDDEKCTCTIHRKDRKHPVRVTEYMAECSRPTAPWKSHPKRMLRHKALIQAARIAFSFAGIFDQDEAERIVEAEVIDVTPGQEVIPGNGKVAPKKLREVVEGMNAAVKAGEAVKAHAIWSQLSNDQILFVWGTLQSWEKSAIKKMQDSPGYKAAANGIDLDAWCFETLRGCKDLAAVEKAYASIQEAYADIDLEVPLDLQTARTDRKAELGASQ